MTLRIDEQCGRCSAIVDASRYASQTRVILRVRTERVELCDSTRGSENAIEASLLEQCLDDARPDAPCSADHENAALL